MSFLLVLLLWQSTPSGGSQEKPPKKKPAERFTIYVDAGPEAATTAESIEKVVERVAKRIGKRKKWLFVTDNPEKAEVFVQVLGHRVRQDTRWPSSGRPTSETRTGSRLAAGPHSTTRSC